MISLSCKKCGKKLKVRDELAGKKLKCPGCAAILLVPVSNDSAEVASRPSPKPAAARTPPVKERGRVAKPAKRSADKLDDDAPEDDDDLKLERRRPGRKPRRPSTLVFMLGAVFLMAGVAAGAGAAMWYLQNLGTDLNNEHVLARARERVEADRKISQGTGLDANQARIDLPFAEKELDRLEKETGDNARLFYTCYGVAGGAVVALILGILLLGTYSRRKRQWKKAQKAE